MKPYRTVISRYAGEEDAYVAFHAHRKFEQDEQESTPLQVPLGTVSVKSPKTLTSDRLQDAIRCLVTGCVSYDNLIRRLRASPQFLGREPGAFTQGSKLHPAERRVHRAETRKGPEPAIATG